MVRLFPALLQESCGRALWQWLASWFRTPSFATVSPCLFKSSSLSTQFLFPTGLFSPQSAATNSSVVQSISQEALRGLLRANFKQINCKNFCLWGLLCLHQNKAAGCPTSITSHNHLLCVTRATQTMWDVDETLILCKQWTEGHIPVNNCAGNSSIRTALVSYYYI